MADIPANNSTTSVITGSGNFSSELELNRDVDWWRIDVDAGLRYDFKLTGDGGPNSLDSGVLAILNANGTSVTSASDGQWVSFTPGSSGSYYVSIADGLSFDNEAEGNYIIQARMGDTVRENVTTTAVIGGTGETRGLLGQENDSDWYRVTLQSGLNYGFTVDGDGSVNSLNSALIILRDANGNELETVSKGSQLDYLITNGGTYYIEVKDGSTFNGEAEGAFIIDAVLTDNIRANVTTADRILDGQTITGAIDVEHDDDWYAFFAYAGRSYTFTMDGSGALDSERLELLNANGVSVMTGGDEIRWTATSTGRYYLSAGTSQFSNDTGDFVLQVQSNSKTLVGTGGNDTLTGHSGVNRILGGAGNDVLDGGGGNDRLFGAKGNDILQGGDGADTAVFESGGAANVDLRIAGAQNTGNGFDQLISIENLVGGVLNDRLVGNNGNNQLEAKAGNDILVGLGGNDTLDGGLGNDRIDGGTGVDTAQFFGNSALNINLAVTGAQNTGQGTDVLTSIENLLAGGGADRLTGNGVANTIRAGGGNDTVIGGGGNDVLAGDSGNDMLDGGTGNDTLNGGGGNDRIIGGAGTDLIAFNGNGATRVILSVTTAQNTGQGLDVIQQIENVLTGDGNDVIIGNNANNVFTSRGGSDVLSGGFGNDRLFGGDGNDRIEGGRGNDFLSGGADADRFVFVAGDGVDRIDDFDNLDLIEIRGATTFADLDLIYSGDDTTIRFAGTSILVDDAFVTQDDFRFT